MQSRSRHGVRTSVLGPDGFYGWRVVALAGLAMGMTAPGQSVGISVFVDPLLSEFALTRTTLSSLYFVGTLAGAAALPGIGRLIDTRGARRTMVLVAAGFGVALAVASGVTGVVTLTLAFVALRMLGAGSLTLTASTSVAFWFERRRGTAVGVTSATGQALISLAPIALAAAIVSVGWRTAWLLAGMVVLVTLVPLAGVFMRDNPSQLGQRPDGDRHRPTSAPVAVEGMSRREAFRTGMFWILVGAIASTAMIVTGLTFHQISILADRGFSTVQAAAIFAPITVAGIASTLLFGWLVDRLSARAILVMALCALGAGMVSAHHVTPGVGALLYAGMLGTAGGATRTLEGSVIPNLFGIRHLGAIRGSVMTATVGASSFGPLAIAIGADRLGGYEPILNLLLVVPATVALAAIFVRPPRRPLPPAGGTS